MLQYNDSDVIHFSHIRCISMKKLGLASALLLAMTGAQAYQFEVVGQSEFLDTTVNEQTFTGALQGTYYFNNVDTTKGPLAEAAFLNQASNVSLAYQYSQYDDSTGQDIESHVYGAKAEAYYATKFAPIYTSATYSHTHNDSKNAVRADDNGDRYALEVGAILAPNFLVAVGYTSIADTMALDAFGIVANGVVKTTGEALAINEDQDAITARTKYVGKIDGTNAAIGFEAGIVYGENTAYQLKSDLYVTPELSVGVSYAETSAKVVADSAWGVNVNYFVTPAIAVGASYVNAEAGTSAKDIQTVGLNAKVRF